MLLWEYSGTFTQSPYHMDCSKAVTMFAPPEIADKIVYSRPSHKNTDFQFFTGLANCALEHLFLCKQPHECVKLTNKQKHARCKDNRNPYFMLVDDCDNIK